MENRKPQTRADLDGLRDEMAAHPDDAMLCTVGEILTVYASDRPALAQMLTAEGKSLQGAIAAMRQAAMKKRKGEDCVALSMTEGMDAVLSYYGLPHDARGILRAALTLADGMPEAVAAAPSRSRATAGLDLDTLLGL